MANLAVFGLGYVGCVTAACFAVCSHDKEAEEILLADSKRKEVIDLVGLPRLKHRSSGYSGIAW